MATNAPTYLLPKKEATESLLFAVSGYLQRKDLSPREKRLVQEIAKCAAQIRKG